jgi:putative inorganic carbon (hco3(-)) transporter
MSRQVTAEPVPRLPLPAPVPPLLLAGLAAGGTGLGIVLAALGVRYGPWTPVAVAVVLVVVVGGLANPRWAVALVFAAVPIGAVEVGPLGVPIIQVAVLGCATLIVLRRISARQAPLPWPWPMSWAAGIVGVAVLETPLAIDPDAAVRQVAQLVTGVLVALAIVAAVRRIQDLRWLLGAFVMVGTAVCLVALPAAGQLRPRYGGAVVENRAQGVFTEPNQLGSFSALLLFLACALWLGGRTSAVRTAAGLAALVAVSALALSLSRGSWLGAIAGTAVLLVMLPMARRRLLLLVPFVVAAVLALAVVQADVPQLGVINERLKTFSTPTASPWDDRPGIYREAWSEIQARPLTGFGPGGFPAASSRAESGVRTVGAFHAHNVLLTVAAESGLPAVVLLIGFTLSVGLVALRTIRRLRARDRPRDAALVAGLAAALMMVVGQGLVDFTLRNPIIVVLVWSVVGLLLAADRVSASPGAPPAGGPAPTQGGP